ncbi:hypothetical protein P4E94_03155 [Pontiellaceae bacterium B12219]|nr:hypothetical protein [Pontiellaceae bacterium B12219]
MGAGLDYNVYWHEGGDVGKILAAQRKKGAKNKIDVHSMAADPLYVDMVHGDFLFKSGSPAIELSIEPMPLEVVARMGTDRDPFLKRFAAGMPLEVHHEAHAEKKN